MANRASRALAGLGVGLGNAGELMLKFHMQDKLQDRYDKRAQEAQMATLTRQGEMADRAQMMKVLEEVMKGADPDAAAEMIALLTGQKIPANALPRPSPRRRMENRFGESIAKATSAEMVPTDEELLSGSRLEGFEGLPPAAVAGMEPQDRVTPPDPFEYAGALPQEFRARAGARRRAWQNKPTEKVEITAPSGAKSTDFRSPYAGPVQTAPTAAEQGTITGTAKVNELATAGGALAEQVGKEATSRTQATQDVELSPDAITKKADLEGKQTYARKVAEINANVDNAQKIIDFETKKALAAMPLAATEVEFKQWGEQIAKAKEAASQAMPVLGQLRALWYKAQPELEKQLAANPDWIVQLRQGYLPRGTMGEDVRKYFDFLEAARPRLARAMGNVGNFTEGEQQRGGYVVADALDAANGGASADEKFNRMEKLFMAAPSIAQRQRPGSKPLTVEEMNDLLDRWTPALQGDVELKGNQPYDILITPDGIKKPGGY